MISKRQIFKIAETKIAGLRLSITAFEFGTLVRPVSLTLAPLAKGESKMKSRPRPQADHGTCGGHALLSRFDSENGQIFARPELKRTVPSMPSEGPS